MTPGFLSRTLDGLRQMLGGTPVKPTAADMTPAMVDLLAFKKTPEERKRRKEAIKAEREHDQTSNKWRWRRWASIILINGLFLASFKVDLQLIEGALTASRVVGFHFADLNSSLQLMLAHGHVVLNLVIGVTTVFLLYLIAGGRAFCSWVCPYHLLSEIAEKLHLTLAEKRLVKDHALDRRLRPVLFVIFAGLAFASGYTLFETISPVGILSRAITYGTLIGLIWVALLLAVEVLWSRRFWCRYVCPIGLTYGIAGTVAPVRILHIADNCFHEGKCRDVCLVPHVLEMTKLGYGRETETPIGPDCTRCAMCIDVCPSGALKFDVKGLSRAPEAAE
ncbi:MAG: NapH/MauN family ferredoxin-type protein [Hyphomicrobiales bacterium]|nr:NapH/MauN family ferredoxin-type protein [Hyphomicrobiales bacterium]